VNELAIGFSIWNRKQHSEVAAKMICEAIVLSGIKSRVVIHADGPRDELEKSDCFRVREAVCEIFDYFAVPYELISQEKNIGLRHSIIYLGNYIFSKNDFCLFIEDDILITGNTLDFIVDRRSMYEHDSNIWSISTHNPCHGTKSSRDFTSPRFNSWGWATWKDRWQKVSFEERILIEFLQNRSLFWNCFTIGKDWIQVAFDRLASKNDSWAVSFQISSYSKGGKHVIPGGTLSSNIGWDNSGVHCGLNEKNNFYRVSKKISKRKPSRALVCVLRNLRVLYYSSSLPNRWTYSEFKKLEGSVNPQTYLNDFADS
jgi:hypothetical protein